MKRKSLGKKLRFEVFKRDGFACQYCGAHPPAVILNADHIVPVAEGGKDALENLITACQACNGGKGACPLTTIPEPLLSRAEQIAERQEQLVAYQQLLKEIEDHIEQQCWAVIDELVPGKSEGGFDRANFLSIKRFIQKLGFFSVKEAAEIAYTRVRWNDHQRFRYFCGVCWGRIREQGIART